MLNCSIIDQSCLWNIAHSERSIVILCARFQDLISLINDSGHCWVGEGKSKEPKQVICLQATDDLK